MERRAVLASGLLLSRFNGARAADELLRWVGSNLPPFIWFGADGAPHGYAHELVQEISRRLGRRSASLQYPWVRALRMARDGEADGVIAMARSPTRESQYRWLIPLAPMRFAFYARAASALDINDGAALKREQIGVVRGAAAAAIAREKGYTQFVETQDYKDLVRHLAMGLIEVAFGGSSLIYAAVEEFGRRPADFRSGLVLDELEMYVATALNFDEAAAGAWQRVYREMQRDGSVARLQRKFPSLRR